MNKSKNKIITMITVLVALGVVIGGAYAINAQLNEEGGSDTEGPRVAVMNFYEEWLTYDGDPMEDRIYENHPALSSDFEQKLSQSSETMGENYDPAVCGNDTPQTIDISYVRSESDTANVGVMANFMETDKQMELKLIRENGEENGKWAIDDITCDTQAEPTELSQEDNQMSDRQSTVENYVRNNISDLAPQTGTTSEQTTFNDIRFMNENNAIVSYNKGDKNHMAVVEFEVNSDNNVRINSFNVLDERVVQMLKAINFSEQGTLVRADDGWQLEYSMNGSQSNTVSLQFSAQTMCIENSDTSDNQKQGMPCTQANLQDGDRVIVNGVKENGTIKVLYMSIM